MRTQHHFVLAVWTIKSVGITECKLSIRPPVFRHPIQRYINGVFRSLHIQLHNNIGRHSEVPVHPPAHMDSWMCGCHDSPVAPDGDDSMGLGRCLLCFRGGKKVEISVQEFLVWPLRVGLSSCRSSPKMLMFTEHPIGHIIRAE